jgi:hypothetical protein
LLTSKNEWIKNALFLLLCFVGVLKAIRSIVSSHGSHGVFLAIIPYIRLPSESKRWLSDAPFSTPGC